MKKVPSSRKLNNRQAIQILLSLSKMALLRGSFINSSQSLRTFSFISFVFSDILESTPYQILLININLSLLGLSALHLKAIFSLILGAKPHTIDTLYTIYQYHKL
jgi:hypothetical protein